MCVCVCVCVCVCACDVMWEWEAREKRGWRTTEGRKNNRDGFTVRPRQRQTDCDSFSFLCVCVCVCVRALCVCSIISPLHLSFSVSWPVFGQSSRLVTSVQILSLSPSRSPTRSCPRVVAALRRCHSDSRLHCVEALCRTVAKVRDSVT